ncbi:MAG: quinohemoprotein amine dehydrogenase maturation protein [Gemmatimonas sp.]|nr:quinohemoprotein amine dehydrogenase maturation protein [Gemmatimonas sp.]
MTQFAARDFHPFEAGGNRYLYLVPSAGVVRLDRASDAVLSTVAQEPGSVGELTSRLSDRFAADEVASAVEELLHIQAIGVAAEPRKRMLKVLPSSAVPLQTMVLNVTSKCNLACTYCYEYGEDRVVDEEAAEMPRFLDEETARQSVDFMFEEAGPNPVVNLTFFGGETLLNFPVLKTTLAYARERGDALGKKVQFSLTTNATLLKPEIVQWLIDNEVGVTVSIDGPKEMQDRFRVFHNGKGSYEVVLPKIRDLLQRHTAKPIGARVTLTRQNLDIIGIYRHLSEEVGFQQVGFAPVTTANGRDYAIEDGENGYDLMLQQFQALAWEFLEYTVAGRRHAFSNVTETLEEIHKGVSKAYPCGAGVGLVGVATNGDVGLCHRFAGSDEHRLGSVGEGIDVEKQREFLDRNHLANKTDCHTCWARPLCAGGCYHEAHTRYGSTEHANLHYCEWIRAWTHTCLEVYGELAERAPHVLERIGN